jgi:hypothetical protein
MTWLNRWTGNSPGRRSGHPGISCPAPMCCWPTPGLPRRRRGWAVPWSRRRYPVNNNAAALVLGATALAAGREIVVSRGELIEIGDRFRLPDLMTSTGAAARGRHHQPHHGRRLRRRHRPGHRIRAEGPPVQLSYFRVHRVSRRRPVRRTGPPVVYDIGSGLLTRTHCCPMSRTPSPRCGPGPPW